MALLTAKCPVPDRERAWIHESMSLFRDQFGDEPLRAPVVLPTSECFPPPYQSSDDDVRALVARVAGYMEVEAELTVQVSNEIRQVRKLQRGRCGVA